MGRHTCDLAGRRRVGAESRGGSQTGIHAFKSLQYIHSMPKPRKGKRYVAKLLNYSLSQRTSSNPSTTTRRHITTSGVSEKEVPRQPRSKPTKEVVVEPLLDAPLEEEAVGVGKDGLEDPVNQVHDPEKLSDEQTQVSTQILSLLDLSLTILCPIIL
jgi:hypothetical protein